MQFGIDLEVCTAGWYPPKAPAYPAERQFNPAISELRTGNLRHKLGIGIPLRRAGERSSSTLSPIFCLSWVSVVRASCITCATVWAGC